MLEHAAKPPAAANSASGLRHAFFRIDQLIAKPLVIPLPVVMNQICIDRTPQRRLAEEDHLVQAPLPRAPLTPAARGAETSPLL